MAAIDFTPAAGNVRAITDLVGADPLEVSYKDGVLTIAGVDQEDLDAALATWTADPELYENEPARLRKSTSFSKVIRNHVDVAYPAYRRELLLALYVEALQNGFSDRADYIQTLLAWVKNLTALAIAHDAALAAAMTIDDILAVDDNSAGVDALLADDPGVTIAGALEIMA